MKKVRHVLGISGGKDSAALAIYLNDRHPELNLEYYFCDTGKELDETYQLIESLRAYLGKEIKKLVASDPQKAGKNPFDFYYEAYRGYLPSTYARWCTKMMKLVPFEEFVGGNQTVSYVGIRGDEDREGYISKKPNIQSIFPFRRNVWSEDVISKVLANDSMSIIADLYPTHLGGRVLNRALDILHEPIRIEGHTKQQVMKQRMDKLNRLLNISVIPFNKVVFEFLKTTDVPLSFESEYPLLENEDVLTRDDIFSILKESGVGVPSYYEKKEYKVNGSSGEYARSRSGCYFCFYQQKIEWIWLYEQHPDLYEKAMIYENEKEGFTWNQHESLKDLIHPLRMEQIKKEHLRRKDAKKSSQSKYLIDILDETEDVGCTACFV